MTTNLLLLAAFVFCMIIMSLNYRKRHHKIVFFGDLITSQGVGWKGYIRNLTEYLNVNDIVDKFDLVNSSTPEFKARVLPEVLAGEKISALAITEPSGGSDVANLRTTARRDGDHYVVNGEKMFITSGMRADYLTMAVRTGGDGPGGVACC